MTGLQRHMPPKGSIFFGLVNDLSRPDKDGWQRREIIFHKAECRTNSTYGYPTETKNDYIILTDTSSNHFRCKFSKTETVDNATLGTPSQLKSWYNQKGFSSSHVNQIGRDGCRDRVFFEYTGDDFEFWLYTENEFRAKYHHIWKSLSTIQICNP